MDDMDETAPHEEHEPGEPEEAGEFHAGFVALVGRPNVGKSTLMNHILGVDLAIATAKPQTTRNRILGVRTFPGKGQLCFVDTPGIHRTDKRLNRAMVQMAIDALQDVDIVCHVVNAADYVHQDAPDKVRIPHNEEFVFERLGEVDCPVFLVVNKIDLVEPKERLLPIIETLDERREFEEVIPLSALKGTNVRRLVDVLLEHLPASAPLFPEDMLTDQAERFLAAEFIREQVLLKTHQEIPYSVAVEIERFAEAPRKDLIEISAVIHVERDSQKGIVIGKGGRRIKQIGQDARRRMEDFFRRKVFLETFVRVEAEWTEKPGMLERFGYE